MRPNHVLCALSSASTVSKPSIPYNRPILRPPTPRCRSSLVPYLHLHLALQVKPERSVTKKSLYSLHRKQDAGRYAMC